MALLNPLRQRGSGGEFLRLVSLDTLPADGTPCKVPVVAERVDAWTRSVEPVGAVFLRRTAEQQVEALHVVCPHAGCTVELKASKDAASGAKQLTYVCPCHKAYFDTSGKRTDAQSMSPRDLDPLPVEIRNGSEVWVQFQNFKTGTPERVAVS
jgi:Rieske Fe-S protein